MRPALERAEADNGQQPENGSIYQALFEEAPKACFSITPDGRVRMANRRALELLGYQLHGVVGRPVLDLYADTPVGKAKAQEVFARFRAGMEICREELEMRRSDGTPVWVGLSVRPIRNAQGRVVASCSMVEEISERGVWKGQRDGGNHHRALFDNGSEIARRLVAFLESFKREQRHLERLMVKSAGRIHFLKVELIDWIGAAGNYAEAHVGPKSYLLRETMNGLEAKLDPHRFLRVHRSAIVNVERIKELQPWYCGDHRVVLQDGTQLTLSRSFRAKLWKLLGKPL
jgi:PAS domain S-box-containing protein